MKFGALQNPAQVAAAMFESTQQTGTGSAQSIAHGLGVKPSRVVVEIDQLPAISGITSGPTTLIAQGTHTTTNVVITALSGLLYRVLALP